MRSYISPGLVLDKSPKDVIASVDEMAGGPLEITSPSQLARDRQQIYNINRGLKRKKSRNTGTKIKEDKMSLYMHSYPSL